YTASMAPIAYDRSIGIGFQLPRNFELRATQHQVDWLGRYGRSLGTADLHTNGAYGLYATFGVRWSFGGYGRQGAPTAYKLCYLRALRSPHWQEPTAADPAPHSSSST